MSKCNCEQTIDLKSRINKLELACRDLKNSLSQYEKPVEKIEVFDLPECFQDQVGWPLANV